MGSALPIRQHFMACRAFLLSETYYRYQPQLRAEIELLADWLIALTTAKKTWGFGLCFLHLRNVKGFKWNHKSVYPLAGRSFRALNAWFARWSRSSPGEESPWQFASTTA
jgi:hypothetical protein